MKRPVLFTIFYGLACAAAYLPLYGVLNVLLGGYTAFGACIWLFLAGYAVYLVRYAGARLLSLVFPLALLLVPLVFGGPAGTFLLLSVGVLSWVRAGLAFENRGSKGYLAELVLGVGGAALVAGFFPYSHLGWAGAVWMFFLIQSLYFVFFEPGEKPGGKPCGDPFERAKRKAESILSGEVL